MMGGGGAIGRTIPLGTRTGGFAKRTEPPSDCAFSGSSFTTGGPNWKETREVFRLAFSFELPLMEGGIRLLVAAVEVDGA